MENTKKMDEAEKRGKEQREKEDKGNKSSQRMDMEAGAIL